MYVRTLLLQWYPDMEGAGEEGGLPTALAALLLPGGVLAYEEVRGSVGVLAYVDVRGRVLLPRGMPLPPPPHTHTLACPPTQTHTLARVPPPPTRSHACMPPLLPQALSAAFSAGADERRRVLDSLAAGFEDAWQRLQLYAHGAELLQPPTEASGAGAGEVTCSTLQRHALRTAGRGGGGGRGGACTAH